MLTNIETFNPSSQGSSLQRSFVICKFTFIALTLDMLPINKTDYFAFAQLLARCKGSLSPANTFPLMRLWVNIKDAYVCFCNTCPQNQQSGVLKFPVFIDTNGLLTIICLHGQLIYWPTYVQIDDH